jgi:HlyD family secretion protein
VLALLLLLGWTVVRPWLLGPVVTAAPVTRTALVRTLVASGHVATLYRTEIGTQISGIVQRIPVREGQTVAAGDTLIVLDDTESVALLQQADALARQADAQVRQLRELTLPSAQQALTQARASLLNVEQTFARNLTAQGFDSPASLDEAQKNLDIARAVVRAAELTVATNTAGGSNFTVVQTQRTQANAGRAAARTRVGYRAILAPRAGVLIARNIEVGDVAQPGAALMQLSPSGNVRVELQVDERNLGQLVLGQSAVVSADAFANERFAATVAYINPGVDLLRASVKVQLAVPSPPTYLQQDMTVSVNVETARLPNVLVVSTADIHDRAGSRPWLLVARGGRAHRQPVTIGLTSAGKAEVRSGLEVGDTVIPLLAGDIAEGDRIRLRVPPAATP